MGEFRELSVGVALGDDEVCRNGSEPVHEVCKKRPSADVKDRFV